MALSKSSCTWYKSEQGGAERIFPVAAQPFYVYLKAAAAVLKKKLAGICATRGNFWCGAQVGFSMCFSRAFVLSSQICVLAKLLTGWGALHSFHPAFFHTPAPSDSNNMQQCSNISKGTVLPASLQIAIESQPRLTPSSSAFRFATAPKFKQKPSSKRTAIRRPEQSNGLVKMEIAIDWNVHGFLLSRQNEETGWCMISHNCLHDGLLETHVMEIFTHQHHVLQQT
jgi:hypothetical protein